MEEENTSEIKDKKLMRNKQQNEEERTRNKKLLRIEIKLHTN